LFVVKGAKFLALESYAPIIAMNLDRLAGIRRDNDRTLALVLNTDAIAALRAAFR